MNGKAAASAGQLFWYGAIGAVAPDIVLMYSKRFTAADLVFDATHYIGATLAYLILAGVLATIVPKKRTTATAFSVGVLVPAIVALIGAVSLPRAYATRGSDNWISTFVELFRMF